MDDDTGFDLTRRKVLGALGSIGVASAGAGLGTSAYFSDQETFTNNSLVAGSLDVKVSWEEHYSDWSDDEGEGLEYDPIMHPPDQGVPGGSPSEWRPFPTPVDPVLWVYEPDIPTFMANTVEERFPAEGADGPLCGPDSILADVPDDLDRPVIDLADVKPGDFGEVTFDFALCDNPGYVWLTGGLVDASENGLTEPESKDPDEREGVVELLDEIQVAFWHDKNCDNVVATEGEPSIAVYSLRELLDQFEAGHVIPVDGRLDDPEGSFDFDCFPARDEDGNVIRHCVGFAWWLPVDHANEIQTDSVTFDLGFYAEQCRHNDGVTLSTDLAAHYPLDESRESGLPDLRDAPDVSGGLQHAGIYGDVSFVNGKIGKAVSLDPDDYLATPGFIDASTVQSRFAWVKPTGGTNGPYPRVLHQENKFELAWKSTENVWGVYDGNDWFDFGTAPTGEWHHVGVVWDGSDLIGYQDGQPFQLATNGGASSTRQIYIGANPSPGGDRLAGLVDDVRIYRRALSSDEVQELATPP
jgi:predicted ribosomally synthesized peptide with SipW-like signal peptide